MRRECPHRRGPLLLIGLIALLCAILLSLPAGAGGRGEPGTAILARVELQDPRSDLARLTALGIDIDAAFQGWARVWLVADEVGKLEAEGFRVTRLPLEAEMPGYYERGPVIAPEGALVPAQYHTYATLTSDLQTIANDHASIARLTSIGRSVQGRELWMLKISDNPDVEEDEPELCYIAAMHGNEVVGKELIFNLADLLTNSYGVDPRLTAVVDGAEIWILPSMNPDGTELGQRWNVNNVDLNRDFPDQFTDPVNSPDGREPETQAVMGWSTTRSIVLAANFHGGTLVVNYPFDGNPAGTNTFSPTPNPDHPAFVSISRSYADHNPPMYQNNTPPFVNGVTNGADWYTVRGGMQDWAYVWNRTFEVTIEVSTSYWPSASTLPTFWNENLESMLSYLERALEGVRGVVTDVESGAPVAATVGIDANPFPSFTDPDVGDYHRIVQPGSYTLYVSAPGYQSQSIPFEVPGGPASRVDVALVPLPTDLEPDAAQVLDRPSGNGYLDPGETADLAVTVRNLGRAASGVTARLEPTGWDVEVVRPVASYPDLGVGQSGTSLAPHFAVQMADTLPSGRRLGFALRWQTSTASGTSDPFFLDVGAASCDTFDATDVPKSILDLQSATSQLSVGTAVTIQSVRVPVNVTHTYIGDLRLVLESPSGTQVVLHNRSGGSADNIVGTYGGNLVPAQPLDVLAGERADGTWSLTVQDQAGGDTGTLNSWGLEICGRPVETSTPEMRFRDLWRGAGDVVLSWWPYPGLTSYKVYRSADPSSAAAFVDVTVEDPDPTDTRFVDVSSEALTFYLVSGVGPNGEGPTGLPEL